MSKHNENRKALRMSIEELESRLVPDASGSVQGLYQQILQRSPSAGELNYWVGREQTVGNAAVIQEIVDSHESHTVEVNQAYQQLLNRSADAGGLTYFANRMDAGETLDEVHGDILESPEFQADHPANASFVQGLYQDELGRSADASGQAYWMGQLQSGVSRAQIIQGFVNSDEAMGREVDEDYSSLLNRPASSSDEAYWVAQYHAGQSQDQIRQSILASGEWQNKHSGSDDGSGSEVGDDNDGSGTEVGDDNGGSGTEVGDDNGGSGTEVGDDNGGSGTEVGDDNGGSHGHVGIDT